MDIIKIAAIDPPATDRSKWARALVELALDQGLPYTPVPIHEATRFTVSFSMAIGGRIRAMATEKGVPPGDVCAGLIRSAQAHLDVGATVESHPQVATQGGGLALIRPVLHPLAEQVGAAIDKGGVAFAEAATGTGKGRLLALHGLLSAASGKRAVIAAPLQNLWQIADEIPLFDEASQVKVAILLGRTNFISKIRLRAWLEENENAALTEWVAAGGPPLSDRAKTMQAKLGLCLNWLFEDASSLADELPAGLMLQQGEVDDESEAVYQRLREEAADADLILCSHHLLASHVRFSIFRSGSDDDEEAKVPAGLPDHMALLLVDEAHLLETAFASIYSSTVHIEALKRHISNSTAKLKGRAVEALTTLGQQVQAEALLVGKGVQGRSGTYPEIQEAAAAAAEAIRGLGVAKKAVELRAVTNYAARALDACARPTTTVRFEVSPVLHYPALTAGCSSLDFAFKRLWAMTDAAALVSATLYSTPMDGGLTRWKLSVPKERAIYLPAVIPGWVTSPVRLQRARVAVPPDDSDLWLKELADQVITAATKAKGGTMVLCTSYATVTGLANLLEPHLGGRLVVQDRSCGAKKCSEQHAALYRQGVRPVWIATGAAWTGINLSDSESAAADDQMLSDLVITRLPIGITRTLTHERRRSLQGFQVETTEACWLFRQGIGRAVRREGTPTKNLWVLDCRIDNRDAWLAPFRRVLSPYTLVAPSNAQSKAVA